MILSGKQIKKQLGHNIHIDPFNEEQLNSNSYNLRLADELMVYEEPVLDMKTPNAHRSFNIPEEGVVLEPGRLYLGRTMEYTQTDDHVPMLEGRSSIGRLGLFIHVTAGFGDVGFSGHWTLEMFCIHPIRIYTGVEVCQIFYHNIEGDYDRYKSKYQFNKGVQPSKLYEDFSAEENTE